MTKEEFEELYCSGNGIDLVYYRENNETISCGDEWVAIPVNPFIGTEFLGIANE